MICKRCLGSGYIPATILPPHELGRNVENPSWVKCPDCSITSFSGEYSFLSNFYLIDITMDQLLVYPSIEHAYQASKTLDGDARYTIAHSPHPAKAKTIGRTVTLREGWEGMKVDVMKSLLIQKFNYPNMEQLLLATGDRRLIEENWWGDRFWGVYRGKGLNMLGKILMGIREEKQGKKFKKREGQ